MSSELVKCVLDKVNMEVYSLPKVTSEKTSEELLDVVSKHAQVFDKCWDESDKTSPLDYQKLKLYLYDNARDRLEYDYFTQLQGQFSYSDRLDLLKQFFLKAHNISGIEWHYKCAVAKSNFSWSESFLGELGIGAVLLAFGITMLRVSMFSLWGWGTTVGGVLLFAGTMYLRPKHLQEKILTTKIEQDQTLYW